MVKNLRHLRCRHRISQQYLAEQVGVSQQSINKYENHKVEPDIRTLTAIADFFGTSVDYLIGRTETVCPAGTEQAGTFTAEEQELLADYRQLSPRDRQCIRLVMERLLENNRRST